MPFKIGEVYRYSSRKKGQSVPPQIVDGMPNFYAGRKRHTAD